MTSAPGMISSRAYCAQRLLAMISSLKAVSVALAVLLVATGTQVLGVVPGYWCDHAETPLLGSAEHCHADEQGDYTPCDEGAEAPCATDGEHHLAAAGTPDHKTLGSGNLTAPAYVAILLSGFPTLVAPPVPERDAPVALARTPEKAAAPPISLMATGSVVLLV